MTGYECPVPQRVSNKNTPVAHAAGATLVAADFGAIHNNTGAGASITLVLPAAAAVAGCALKIQVTVAQTIVLDPGTGKIYLGGSGVADKTLTLAGVIGNHLDLHSDGVDYVVDGYSGVATKEA